MSNFTLLNLEENFCKWIHLLQHSLHLRILILSKAAIMKNEITLTLGHYLITAHGIILFVNILSNLGKTVYLLASHVTLSVRKNKP